MAKTSSSMQMPLGAIAPDFTLLDTVSDQQLSLQDVRGEKATVVMFICNHCPFVIHVAKQLTQLGNDYQNKGLGFVAISANDVVNYPADAPDLMKTNAQENQFPFAYLYDETQAVAKAYQAACTPDFYIFDHDLRCVYRGQLDDSSPGNDIPVSGKDIRAALDNLLANRPISQEQKPSMGCNIKWR